MRKILASRDVPQIITRLYALGIISQSEFEKISKQRSDSEQMQRIVLYSIMPGTRQHLYEFIEILNEKNPDVVRSINNHKEHLTEGNITLI